jgi:hypothetical protein
MNSNPADEPKRKYTEGDKTNMVKFVGVLMLLWVYPFDVKGCDATERHVVR